MSYEFVQNSIKYKVLSTKLEIRNQKSEV